MDAHTEAHLCEPLSIADNSYALDVAKLLHGCVEGGIILILLRQIADEELDLSHDPS